MRGRPSRIAFAALGALLALSSASAARAQSPTTAAERATAWATHQALDRASPFRGLAWRPVGPVRIGARVEAIAIPPGNTGTIYVGVGSGNLWKTVNNGLTWRAIFEHESAFAIGDVEVAPSDPRIVWVGTGEAQPRYAGYAYPGTGVFKSTDAGETWTAMGLAETHHIGKVLIDPRDPDVVFVAAMGHQWSANRERGVFRTEDGGAHWEQVLHIDDSTGVVDLAMDPSDPRILFAWAWQIEQGRSGGLFKSTDGGRHWRRASNGLPTGPLGRAGIAVAASAPGVVYLHLDDRSPSSVKDRPFVGGSVYRSDDHGEQWRRVDRGEALVRAAGDLGVVFLDDLHRRRAGERPQRADADRPQHVGRARLDRAHREQLRMTHPLGQALPIHPHQRGQFGARLEPRPGHQQVGDGEDLLAVERAAPGLADPDDVFHARPRAELRAGAQARVLARQGHEVEPDARQLGRIDVVLGAHEAVLEGAQRRHVHRHLGVDRHLAHREAAHRVGGLRQLVLQGVQGVGDRAGEVVRAALARRLDLGELAAQRGVLALEADELLAQRRDHRLGVVGAAAVLRHRGEDAQPALQIHQAGRADGLQVHRVDEPGVEQRAGGGAEVLGIDGHGGSTGW